MLVAAARPCSRRAHGAPLQGSVRLGRSADWPESCGPGRMAQDPSPSVAFWPPTASRPSRARRRALGSLLSTARAVVRVPNHDHERARASRASTPTARRCRRQRIAPGTSRAQCASAARGASRSVPAVACEATTFRSQSDRGRACARRPSTPPDVRFRIRWFLSTAPAAYTGTSRPGAYRRGPVGLPAASVPIARRSRVTFRSCQVQPFVAGIGPAGTMASADC